MCRSDGAYKELHRVLFANDVLPRWGFFYFSAFQFAPTNPRTSTYL